MTDVADISCATFVCVLRRNGLLMSTAVTAGGVHTTSVCCACCQRRFGAVELHSSAKVLMGTTANRIMSGMASAGRAELPPVS